MQTQTQTLPTNAQTLKEYYDKEFASMQRQYRRHIVEWKTFEEPSSLPNTDITLHHLFNVATHLYPNEKASKDLLQRLPPLPQFQNTKSKALDEQKPPSATIQKETILKEDKEDVLNEKIRVLKEDIEAKNKKIKELNETHAGEIQTYKQKVTQLENDESTAMKIAKERLETIQKLQNDLQTLRTGKESAEKQLQTAQTTQTSISDTIKTMQTNHDDKMSALSEKHEKEMSEMSAKLEKKNADILVKHAADIADIESRHRQELSDLENSKNTEGVELRADIADKEKLIAELQARLNKGFFKYRKPTKLEMINIISNVIAAIGFSETAGVFGFIMWSLMALFYWDTLLTIRNVKNEKSGEFGYWVNVGIDVIYGFVHPTAIMIAVAKTEHLIADKKYYGYVGAIVLVAMSIISLNQSMNKAQDKASTKA